MLPCPSLMYQFLYYHLCSCICTQFYKKFQMFKHFTEKHASFNLKISKLLELLRRLVDHYQVEKQGLAFASANLNLLYLPQCYSHVF